MATRTALQAQISTYGRQRVWRGRREFLGRVSLYTVLTLGATLMLFPFIWMVLLSLQSLKQFESYPPTMIPDPCLLSNYPEALVTFPFLHYLRNTAIITFTSLAGSILSSTLVAYAFARLRWPGRDLMFVVMLATMMLPPQVTLIPVYIVWRSLGCIDTYWPLIAPAFLGQARFIFLARQYFMSIPAEIEDAARIDGSGFFQIWWRIMIPLSIPLVLAISLFSIVAHWNDFFRPLLYLNTIEKYTLQLGLMYFNQQYRVNYPLMMAASVVIVMPMVVIFLIGQRYFIGSIVLTGLKG